MPNFDLSAHSGIQERIMLHADVNNAAAKRLSQAAASGLVIPDHRLLRRFEVTSKCFSFAVILIGLIALAGYLWNIPEFISVRSGLQGMSPLTATGLLCVASANLAAQESKRLIACCIALTAAIGSAVLASHLFVGSDVVSQALTQWLFPHRLAFSGLTSIATATCLGLLAAAQATRLFGKHNTAELFAALTLIIAGLGTLGYVYGVKDLYSLYPFNTMALQTALSLVLSASATLLIEPGGWMTTVISARQPGAVTRRQLTLTAILPFIGWLLIYAVDTHVIGPAAAIALVVILMFLPLVTLIIRDGIVLTRLDDQQRINQRLERNIRAALELELEKKRSALEKETLLRKDAESAMYRSQRLDAIGQLTGGIAHDFNNLLMAISGNLEIIQRKLPEESDVLKNVSRAAQAAGKGIKLTGQLLAFSRTQRLEVQSVALDKIINAALGVLGNALGPNIVIEIGTYEKGLWITTDPLQFEVAILNLALNARDAMPNGGKFSISIGNLSDAASTVEIIISDTGVGMSPETAAKAGEPFFTTKEHGKGTGLGLAQVYGLCRQSGGDLRIISKVDSGTTIVLVLPLAHPVQPTVKGELASDRKVRMHQAKLPILVVDDDDNVRGVLSDSLQLEGYTVYEAADGVQALAILESTTCAAAVVDFLMPGMNGADLARKARIFQPNLPIVFVSGFSDTLALDAIFDAVVIRKPFELERLHEALATFFPRESMADML
jgi:signal transduction histidine kinase/ActR/RegA family two-component response regulator